MEGTSLNPLYSESGCAVKALEFIEDGNLAADFEFLWGQKLVFAGNSYWLRRLCLDRLRRAWSDFALEETTWDLIDGLWIEHGLFGARLFVIEGVSQEKKHAKLRGLSPNRLAVLTETWKGEADAVIDCDLPFARDLADWATRAARKRGYELVAEAAALVARTGDLCGIELDKLLDYAGSRSVVTRQDAELLICTAHGEARAWSIMAELKEGGNPWGILESMFEGDEDERKTAFAFALQLQGPLTRLTRAVALRRAGKSPQEAFDQAGIESYRAGEAARTIGFLRKRLFRVYDWLLELDMALKGRGDAQAMRPRTLCVRFVAKLLGTTASGGGS